MPELYIGIMSGTSLDGIDAVLVDFSPPRPTVISKAHRPFKRGLREQLLQLTLSHTVELKTLGQLDHQLGLSYADIVNELLTASAVAPSEITAIGSHGQTIYHQPDGDYPFSMQIGDANLIAEKTTITTVADFRRRDMAAGGEGAPLVPAFHAAIFGDDERDCTVLNIGGIANLSILPKNSSTPVSGFDSGPGNILLDGWIQLKRGNSYDSAGKWGATGRIIPDLLEQLLNEPYFKAAAPKSTGRELFNIDWLQSRLSGGERDEDVQATLYELTAISIADAVKQQLTAAKELIVCGGGVFNIHLIERISHHLPDCEISSSERHGLDPQLIEAMAFAWLARETLSGRAGNIPEVTGANRPVILGAIYPA
ncbi:MAG: anhydro-N-acetylmuramic acid kinase [Gammaproteobacteria bacterium]|nr:anhydro-N-acetylmuramic acid kinase [Gammaproteobacteria bacterium]